MSSVHDTSAVCFSIDLCLCLYFYYVCHIILVTVLCLYASLDFSMQSAHMMGYVQSINKALHCC